MFYLFLPINSVMRPFEGSQVFGYINSGGVGNNTMGILSGMRSGNGPHPAVAFRILTGGGYALLRGTY